MNFPPFPVSAAARTSRRRWVWLGLGLLLVLTALAAAWLAAVMPAARRQKAAVETIAGLEGSVCYDYQKVRDPRPNVFDVTAAPPGPAWLHSLIGADCFRNVVRVDLRSTRTVDGDLAVLESLPKLDTLDLGHTRITGAGLVHLRRAANLQSLYLDRTVVDDAGLEHLRGLAHLKLLILDGTQVTDAGVEQLQQALPNCEINR